MLNPYITEYPAVPEIFAGREREIENEIMKKFLKIYGVL